MESLAVFKTDLRNHRLEGISIIHVILVSFLLLALTTLHYITAPERFFLHVFYRDLYFLPILLSGFWFGLKGGFLAAAISSSLYAPLLMGTMGEFREHDLGNLLQLLLFNIVGLLVGWLKDRASRQNQQLQNEADLAAMGKALACVAHDMKTPLITIGGFVRQMQRKSANDEGTAKKLDLILHQTVRLEAMVQEMLSFSKPLKLSPRYQSLQNLFHDSAIIMKKKANARQIFIHVQLEDDVPLLSFDFNQLQRALINLIDNGIEASPEGGEVIIRGSSSTDRLTIEIEDNGPGIPSYIREKIFLPFYTCKKEGTGLGLPIARKIAEAHKGRLLIIKSNKYGSIFQIAIPRSEPDSNQAEDQAGICTSR